MLKLTTKRRIYCITTLLILVCSQNIFSQSIWTELSEMPMAVANNAVTHGTVGDTTFVYTFGGIDSTKTLSGINQNAMRYNTVTDQWSIIPSLPDTLGKIASAASTVNNIIYITGGYHVFSGSPFELSSDKIHRYDPETNQYLTDGAPMPFAIDDQVQSVWRDSLIFMITGWSDNTNVPHVQIYNPSLDEWSIGTSTPNFTTYKAFGASGVIIGDTILYNGGAAGSSFNSVEYLRRGIINPEDPTDITWDLAEENPGAKGYRMASVAVEEKAYWIGGSGITYNFNGIAYNGSGGVPPLNRIMSYNTESETWFEEMDQPYGVMDLRGAAKVDDNKFIICGGMLENQVVSNKTFLIEIDVTVGVEELSKNEPSIFPNPVNAGQEINVSINKLNIEQEIYSYEIFSSQMQLVSRVDIPRNLSNIIIETDGWNAGIYFLKLNMESGDSFIKQMVISD